MTFLVASVIYSLLSNYMSTARKMNSMLLTVSIVTVSMCMVYLYVSSPVGKEQFVSQSITVSDEPCTSTPLTLPSATFQSHLYYTVRGASITPVESVTPIDLYNEPSSVSAINLEEMIADRSSSSSSSAVPAPAAIVQSAIPWTSALL